MLRAAAPPTARSPAREPSLAHVPRRATGLPRPRAVGPATDGEGGSACALDRLTWGLLWVRKGSCFLEGGGSFLPDAHPYFFFFIILLKKLF